MKAFITKHIHLICSMVLIVIINTVFDPSWYISLGLAVALGRVAGILMAHDEAKAKR